MGQIDPRGSLAWRDWERKTGQTPHFWVLNLYLNGLCQLQGAADKTGCGGGLHPQPPYLHHEPHGHDGARGHGHGGVGGGRALHGGKGLA